MSSKRGKCICKKMKILLILVFNLTYKNHIIKKKQQPKNTPSNPIITLINTTFHLLYNHENNTV